MMSIGELFLSLHVVYHLVVTLRSEPVLRRQVMHRLDIVEHAHAEWLRWLWHVTPLPVYLPQVAKLVVDVEQAFATCSRSSILTSLLAIEEVLVESANEARIPLHIVVFVLLLKAHALLVEPILLLFELGLPVESFEAHVNLSIADLILVVAIHADFV
jgi:hypothetical protein